MSRIFDFTVEETQLISLYMPKESRVALMKAILRDKDRMEEGVQAIAGTVLDKLAEMKEKDFADTEFLPEI